MADEQIEKRVEDLVRECAERLKRNDKDGASYCLSQALDVAGEIENVETRRLSWSALAKHMINAKFPELANLAAKRLIPLDRRIGKTQYLITDLLSYGSSLHLSAQHAAAADIYRQALDLSLKTEAWHNAASASSNLAAALAALGDLQEARHLLDKSLEYLKRQPWTDTEIRTWAMVIGIMNQQGEPAQKCFDVARQVLDKYRPNMNSAFRSILQRALDPVLKKFFSDNPQIDPGQWVPSHFPELMDPDHV